MPGGTTIGSGMCREEDSEPLHENVKTALRSALPCIQGRARASVRENKDWKNRYPRFSLAGDPAGDCLPVTTLGLRVAEAVGLQHMNREVRTNPGNLAPA